MQYLGQWQKRCEAIVEELGSVSGALCIDNLLGLIRAGGRDPSAGVAAFFASYLERGELRMVAEATPEELDASRRLMPGLASLFQIVRIEPFEPHVAPVVLGEVSKAAQRAARVECAPGVPGAVHHLFRRFMPYHPFPVRIPVKPITHSGRNRSPVPVETDHPFRPNPIHPFGARRRGT